jgi:hypothetical protein
VALLLMLFVFVALALLLLLLPLVLVHVVLVLPPDVIVVHDANTLVGLNDSMAVIRARDMLKDNIITAVRFKVIMKINKKLIQKDYDEIFYTVT